MSDGELIVGSTFLAGIEAHPLGQMQCPVGSAGWRWS